MLLGVAVELDFGQYANCEYSRTATCLGQGPSDSFDATGQQGLFGMLVAITTSHCCCCAVLCCVLRCCCMRAVLCKGFCTCYQLPSPSSSLCLPIKLALVIPMMRAGLPKCDQHTQLPQQRPQARQHLQQHCCVAFQQRHGMFHQLYPNTPFAVLLCCTVSMRSSVCVQ